MKISRNWLNDYINSEKTNEELVEAFIQLGLECAVEKVDSNFSNIIIGEIKKCAQHPNAERLKVCEVSVGKNKSLTIVCGAPNVIAGIKVPVDRNGFHFRQAEPLAGEVRDKIVRTWFG